MQFLVDDVLILKCISRVLDYIYMQFLVDDVLMRWLCNINVKGGGGGGVQAYHFGQNDFELGVGGEGQDTSQHFEGSFESIRAILPMWAPEQKQGQKPKSGLKEIKLTYFSPFDLSLKN